jgi:hypothetical protein
VLAQRLPGGPVGPCVRAAGGAAGLLSGGSHPAWGGLWGVCRTSLGLACRALFFTASNPGNPQNRKLFWKGVPAPNGSQAS